LVVSAIARGASAISATSESNFIALTERLLADSRLLKGLKVEKKRRIYTLK
jgi:hypothetical protein